MLVEVNAFGAGLLRELGVTVCTRCASGESAVRRAFPSYYTTEWAGRLYHRCGGRLLSDGIHGPWSSLFRYTVLRAIKDSEFREALIAAMDAHLLVPFISQQRHPHDWKTEIANNG